MFGEGSAVSTASSWNQQEAFPPGVLRGLLPGLLINKTFQVQAESLCGSSIQLSEAEPEYPCPPWTRILDSHKAALVDEAASDTATLHDLNSELSPGVRDTPGSLLPNSRGSVRS